MRPYQDHTRAEIAAKFEEITRERKNVLSLLGKLEAETAAYQQGLTRTEKTFWGGSKTVDQPATPAALAKHVANMSQQLELQKMRAQFARTEQDLQFELKIRDTPALLQEFGPGRD